MSDWKRLMLIIQPSSVRFCPECHEVEVNLLPYLCRHVVAGTVEAFAEEDPETALTGVTVEGQTVSCESFTQEKNYIVRGLMTVNASVQTVSFNNKKLPKDYFITMTTQDKGEDGSLVDKQITAYKATPKRNFELSLSSTGDPVTVTMEFDCMEDKDGNQLDMSVFED